MATRKEIEDTRPDIIGLEKMAASLGYGDPLASPLVAFFADNPGACEAVIQWVLDEGCHRDGSDLDEESEDEESEDE